MQRIARRYAAALLIVSLASTAAAAADTPPAARAAKKIVVIAHRGAHNDAPENTLAALEQAVALGCDYVEVDVRRTKDGELVIMHDASVDRTTNGRGKIEEMTLAEIQKLDVGVKRGKKWAGERVPTFDDVLARAKGRMKIYVDHKKAPPAQVLAAIQKHGMLREVVVYGSVPILREYKQLAPSVWIMPDHPESVAGIEALARDLKPETLDGSIIRWTRPQVEAAHRAGIQVWVDNVSYLDNESGIKNAVDMGIDAIQTDHPEIVLRLLTAMGRRGRSPK